jgi:urease subunit gamma/beta
LARRRRERGLRLDVPESVAVTVPLVPFRGDRVVIGFSGLVDGPLDAPGAREAALARAEACGYLTTEEHL